MNEQLNSTQPERKAGSKWMKICCGGCLALVLLFILGAGLLLRGLGNSSGPKTVSELPVNFPEFELYAFDEVDSIEYYSGKDKDRAFTSVFSPLKLFGSIMVFSKQTNDSSTNTKRILERFMESNGTRLQQIDTVTVRWIQLRKSRDVLVKFYQDQFKRDGFTVGSASDAATASETYVAAREGVAVQLQIQDVPDIDGIDTVTIKIDYANQ